MNFIERSRVVLIPHAAFATASRKNGIHSPDLSERLILFKLRKSRSVVSKVEFLMWNLGGPVDVLASDNQGIVFKQFSNVVVKWERLPMKEKIPVATPLLRAIRKKKLSEITKLILAGANVNTIDEYQTPLFKAVKTGSPKVVDLLMKLGADANKYETTSWNYNIFPFHYAVQLNHYKIVKLFTEKWKIRADQPVQYNDYGWPPEVTSFVNTEGLAPNRLEEAKKILALLQQTKNHD